MPSQKKNKLKVLEAGDFLSWVVEMNGAIRGKNDSNVSCHGCVACCTSSQFVHIGPGEAETLSHIPKKLLFPAPRMPLGHFLLGYDKRGHCPMLIHQKCSIYEYRPRTCRTYDCRIFSAAGLLPDENQVSIARQAKRWHFSFQNEDDCNHRKAVQAAAVFLRKNTGKLPPEIFPRTTTQWAVLAFRIHEAFLKKDDKTGRWVGVDSVSDAVLNSILRRVR
jgi:Fe-S-cluster containining protein